MHIFTFFSPISASSSSSVNVPTTFKGSIHKKLERVANPRGLNHWSGERIVPEARDMDAEGQQKFSFDEVSTEERKDESATPLGRLDRRV